MEYKTIGGKAWIDRDNEDRTDRDRRKKRRLQKLNGQTGWGYRRGRMMDVAGHGKNACRQQKACGSYRQNRQTIHVPKPTVIVDARKQAPYDFLRFQNWIGGTVQQSIGDWRLYD